MSIILWSSLIQDIFQNILTPILVGTVTYIVFRRLDEWKKRRSQSKLGVAVLASLIEEVKNGIIIMNTSISMAPKPQNQLPKKSWNGMTTISDDILLRILEVSPGVSPNGFPLNEIRIHCKNYFDHMTVTWENSLNSPYWKTAINGLVTTGKFVEAAENVLRTLEQCRDLLDKNSKRNFPK